MNFHQFFRNKYSTIDKLNITLKVIPQNTNASKASGPDHILGRLLKELAQCFIPYLCTDGVISSDWSLAYITPISKKGNKNFKKNLLSRV